MARQAKTKYMPVRLAWIKNSKAVSEAEFEDEQATEHAGMCRVYVYIVLAFPSGTILTCHNHRMCYLFVYCFVSPDLR